MWVMLMNLYRRYTSILVGNKQITSDDLDIEFDIPFTKSKEQDIGEVVVYNLSEDTINDIKEHNNINISAGYKDANNVATIFTGVVKKVIPEWSGANKAVTLLLADGGFQWARSSLKRTYPKGSSASFIMRDLVNQMGQKPALIAPVNDIVYENGFIINGLQREELQRIVDETGSTMRNEAGFVYINDGAAIHETGFRLNSDTGLIGVPTEEVETLKDGKTKVTYYNVTMLLNPLIKKGSKLKIESYSVHGEFVVESGRHTKDFNTEAKVRRV